MIRVLQRRSESFHVDAQVPSEAIAAARGNPNFEPSTDFQDGYSSDLTKVVEVQVNAALACLEVYKLS